MRDDWDKIVLSLYDNNVNPFLRSIKIPIYMIVSTKYKVGLKYIIKFILKLMISYKNSTNHIRNKSYEFVFLLPYDSPSNKDNLMPVINKCIDKSYNILVILGDSIKDIDFNINKLKNNCIRMDNLYGELTYKEKLYNIYLAINILRDVLNIFSNNKYIRGKLIGNILELYYYIYSSLLYKAIFTKLFNNMNVKYAICTSDFWPEENQFISCAKNKLIKSYVIMHGIIVNYWWPFDSDYYIVWGELHKKIMMDLGAPEEKLIIGGMPALDKWEKYNLYKDRISTNPWKILIISSTHAPQFNELLDKKFSNCLLALNNFSDRLDIIVKLHPVENMSFYIKHGFDKNNNYKFYKSEKGIHELIIESDLCISIFSTGGLEAVALDRPSLVLNLNSDINQIAWWPKYGGGVYIKNDDELKEFIKILLGGDYDIIYNILDTQKCFKGKSFFCFGKSSEYIVNYIRSSCGN